MLQREKEKSVYIKGIRALSSPPRTSGSKSLLSTRAYFPNGSKPDFTSIKPLLSFLLATPGHYLLPLFLSREQSLTLEAT